IDQQIPLPKNFQFAMFILQFAMFDWFANNITHRIFISPGSGDRWTKPWRDQLRSKIVSKK
ncbi:hypothetical protein, partial [Rubripirellula obstinata]|uniref:hypothetical protein n=1 Tax=Rubripirellula obstinata TaxID=406547 RepID=UPI001EE4CA97